MKSAVKRDVKNVQRNLFLVLLAAAGLTGCSAMGSAHERVTVVDPDLRDMLRWETKDPKWNEAGQLLAQTNIQNIGPDKQHILLQTMFFDVDGSALEPDAPWVNEIIPEYSTVYYRKTSLREGAVDYQMHVRRGKIH